ncbi:MAG: hypothetical protein J5I92_06660 [Thiogranum sp.]|nr:hypothetical protein [Thiogranum sp.]
MKTLVIILTGLSVSWYFTNLTSEQVLSGVVAPFLVFVFLVALAWWLVLKAGFGSKGERGGLFGGDDGNFGGGGDGAS